MKELRKTLRRAFLISVLMTAGVVLGDETALPLKEIGRRASENAALIRAQSKEMESAQLDVDGAGLLANPAFSLQLGGLRSGDSSGMTVEGFLSQTIPFPGKLKSQRYLKEVDLKLTKATLEQSKNLIQHQAVLLGFQWLALDENIKHFQERQKRFREIREYFRTHPQLSPATKVDAQLIETQILLIEKNFVEMEKDKKLVEQQLQFYLQSSGPIRPVPEWIEAAKISPSELRAAMSLDKTPELLKKRLDIEQAKNNVEQNRLKTLPDFTLGAGYRNEAVAPANHFYYGSIGLMIPIFDRGQYSVPAAEAKLDAESARESMLRSKLRSEVDSAFLELESAKKIATSLSLQKANSLDAQFDQIGREFRKGRVTTTAFLQADAQLHELTASIYEAQLTLAQRLSQLKALFGEPLSWE